MLNSFLYPNDLSILLPKQIANFMLKLRKKTLKVPAYFLSQAYLFITSYYVHYWDIRNISKSYFLLGTLIHMNMSSAQNKSQAFL